MNGCTEHEWLSYHLFPHGPDDQILSRLVMPVVCDLWNRQLIRRFFFIRYDAGGPHIRLRLLCSKEHSEDAGGILQAQAADFFADTKGGATNDAAVEIPFSAEVERYGGPELIGHSLDYFCVSSAYVLRLACSQECDTRARRLTHGMIALLRQALGFAADAGELPRLVAFPCPPNDGCTAPLIARAEREFERCRDDYLALVSREIESSSDTATRTRLDDRLLTEAAQCLARRIRETRDSVRWRILTSQLHMTSNRIGLINLEEVYVGHILRRALTCLSHLSEAGPWSPRKSHTCPGAYGGEDLAVLATGGLSQLASADAEDRHLAEEPR